MAHACEGLMVLDFSQGMAGPMAGGILADYGATVIKIEPPAGDWARQLPGFHMWNRGKQSVVLDLGTEEGRAGARQLAAAADVLIEAYRPGVAGRLGIGSDDLQALNPALVYCSITGFGRGGGATLPGYDLLIQALGGLMSITGSPDGEPQKVGVAAQLG